MLPTKKEIAQQFLLMCAKGDSREAFKQHIGDGFTHHNAYFKGDAETLMVAMEEAHKANPQKIFEIQRALGDGDLVAVHSRVRQKPSDPDMAVIHILRFAGEKIFELWDFGQAVPADSPNENGMF